MKIFVKNKSNYKYLTHFFIILLCSFFINFYYAKIGVFPIDTFLHYDAAYRILNNEYPVRDFWVVSGLTIDFLQAFFFKVFGVNWFSYTLHSSLFNCLIGLMAYNFFLSLKISEFKSLFYTLCLVTLAYTISGTPFVDQHAVFFLLITTFLILNFISNPKKKYLLSISILTFFLSFLSKQVPSVYAFIFFAPIMVYYLIKTKNLKILKSVLLYSLIFTLIFYFVLLSLKIEFRLFFDEYINFPRSIGVNRFNILDYSLNSFFNKYKFILLPIFLIFILKIRNLKLQKKLNFDYFIKLLIIFSYTFSLIFHQIMTKNQIFIYFLIPILFAILDIEFNQIKSRFKNSISIFFILLLLFITVKYHLRFNENRKFHELSQTNLSTAVEAEILDQSLSGLKWVNPFFRSNPSEEISILKRGVKELDNSENEIMLITNYLFIDSITKKSMNYPSRAITSDGTTFPLKGSKYFDNYKVFLKDIIKEKKIKEVYFFKHELIPQKHFTNYFSKECYNLENEKESLFFKYRLICLN